MSEALQREDSTLYWHTNCRYTFFSSRVIFGLREKNSLKQYTRFTLILYVFPCIIALMEFGERMYGDGIYVLS